MTPSLIGRDPVLTQGLLRDFVLITELILNILYTMSIWNLGTMFGVMTDKGVRTSGFYSVVRHPSYTLESLMFLMMFLNGLSSSSQWLAIGVFIFNYYVRSEREDQFMSESNPDYKIYQEKTVYKFIPGIY
jgi:protein-S-isoprenylcysteine O-methyltransferase Ste14